MISVDSNYLAKREFLATLYNILNEENNQKIRSMYVNQKENLIRIMKFF